MMTITVKKPLIYVVKYPIHFSHLVLSPSLNPAFQSCSLTRGQLLCTAANCDFSSERDTERFIPKYFRIGETGDPVVWTGESGETFLHFSEHVWGPYNRELLNGLWILNATFKSGQPWDLCLEQAGKRASARLSEQEQKVLIENRQLLCDAAEGRCLLTPSEGSIIRAPVCNVVHC